VTTRGRRPRLRTALLSGIVAAIAVLALVIMTDPRRVGVFRDTAGRTAAPDEAGWVHAAAAQSD
jgi:hypothetical protein